MAAAIKPAVRSRPASRGTRRLRGGQGPIEGPRNSEGLPALGQGDGATPVTPRVSRGERGPRLGLGVSGKSGLIRGPQDAAVHPAVEAALGPAHVNATAGRMRRLALESQLSATRSAVICALHQVLDLKDLNTGGHSARLAEWGIRVAEDLGMEEGEFQAIEISALLHDIGKMGVPDAILQKPGPLDDAEFAVMKRHPEHGWAILRHIPGFATVSHFVLHHHERMDGRGYPAGLLGEQIPLGARVIAVIDAFDAMVSARPYRQGLPAAEAMRRLHVDAGTQFDRRVVASFTSFASAEMAAVAAAGT